MRTSLLFSIMLILSACSHEPEEINYSKDICQFCKMTIIDKRFATECISTKGKIFKFDDAFCLIKFLKNGGVWSNEVAGIYFTSYNGNQSWIKSDKAILLKGENLRSPMGGNIAAFSSKEEAEKVNKEINGVILLWDDVKPKK